jgi:alpha-D-ribose 1-methylphosphonate 5-triphosphate synthase subunit PhnI
MTEGSLYDRRLAALAIKQAQGDMVEAIFLLRAYRTTLPRFGYSLPMDTGKITIQRRISAAYKDLPGGQVLGGTYDYTHRLLDFSLAAKKMCNETSENVKSENSLDDSYHLHTDETMQRIADVLSAQGMIEPDLREETGHEPNDITREPLQLPADRGTRLQNLFRGDEGFILAMGYSTQRGFGASVHPFMGEIRFGRVEIKLVPEDLGFAVTIGEIEITECVMLHRFSGNSRRPPQFIKGYGLTFGRCERKAMAMALVDRALRSRELGEIVSHPAQDEEFVLFHSDDVEASGFVQHLKLPHYVDFQADLVLMRKMLADYHQKLTEVNEEDIEEMNEEDIEEVHEEDIETDADKTSHAA